MSNSETSSGGITTPNRIYCQDDCETRLGIEADNTESSNTVDINDFYNDATSNIETEQRPSGLLTNRWETIDLGLIQTILSKFLTNLTPKSAVIGAIIFTVIFRTF